MQQAPEPSALSFVIDDFETLQDLVERVGVGFRALFPAFDHDQTAAGQRVWSCHSLGTDRVGEQPQTRTT